jgi:hypothetical protein
MQTYLRFARTDIQAIVGVCRPLELTEESFRTLKPFLVGALRDIQPELSQRIAGLRTFQIGILFKYLKERREAAASRRRFPPEHSLNHEEFRVLSEAFRGIRLQARFLSYSRDLLVLQFREASPNLAAKLTCLSESQFERLCDHMQQRDRKSS